MQYLNSEYKLSTLCTWNFLCLFNNLIPHVLFTFFFLLFSLNLLLAELWLLSDSFDYVVYTHTHAHICSLFSHGMSWTLAWFVCLMLWLFILFCSLLLPFAYCFCCCFTTMSWVHFPAHSHALSHTHAQRDILSPPLSQLVLPQPLPAINRHWLPA